MTKNYEIIKTGWLDTDGRLTECEYWGHLKLAEEIIEHFRYSLDEKRITDIYAAIMDRGWIQISWAGLEHCYYVFWSRRPTDKQIEYLKEVMLGNESRFAERCIEDFKDLL